VRAAVAAALVLLALPAAAGTPAHGAAAAKSETPEARGAARLLVHHANMVSGYGEKFYNVVGRLQNTSDHPLAYVKLRVEVVDAHGKVVASSTTFNESAELLSDPEIKSAELLASGKVKPVAPGATERFRATFLEDETPAFTDYRVHVIEAPAANP
jgi:hypothetical protein